MNRRSFYEKCCSLVVKINIFRQSNNLATVRSYTLLLNIVHLNCLACNKSFFRRVYKIQVQLLYIFSRGMGIWLPIHVYVHVHVHVRVLKPYAYGYVHHTLSYMYTSTFVFCLLKNLWHVLFESEVCAILHDLHPQLILRRLDAVKSRARVFVFRRESLKTKTTARSTGSNSLPSPLRPH